MYMYTQIAAMYLYMYVHLHWNLWGRDYDLECNKKRCLLSECPHFKLERGSAVFIVFSVHDFNLYLHIDQCKYGTYERYLQVVCVSVLWTGISNVLVMLSSHVLYSCTAHAGGDTYARTCIYMYCASIEINKSST